MTVPCFVCGTPTDVCVPFTFCPKCVKSKAAAKIMDDHAKWFKYERKRLESMFL